MPKSMRLYRRVGKNTDVPSLFLYSPTIVLENRGAMLPAEWLCACFTYMKVAHPSCHEFNCLPD
jgi:hypothetical protein